MLLFIQFYTNVCTLFYFPVSGAIQVYISLHVAHV